MRPSKAARRYYIKAGRLTVTTAAGPTFLLSRASFFAAQQCQCGHWENQNREHARGNQRRSRSLADFADALSDPHGGDNEWKRGSLQQTSRPCFPAADLAAVQKPGKSACRQQCEQEYRHGGQRSAAG